MREPGGLSRREWLALIGASGASSLAGCNSQNSDATASSTETSESTATTTTAQDDTAPVVANFSVETTASANRLAYRLRLASGDGEVTAEIASESATDTRTIASGEQRVTGDIEAPAGEGMLEAVVRDGAGNETSVLAAGYARRYDVLTDGSHALGATYYPGVGGDWQDCIEGAPAVGEYGVAPAPAVVNAQTDHAQAAGISRWIVNIRHPTHLDGAEVLSTGALGGEVPVEFDLDVADSLGRPMSFDSLLGSVQDAIEDAPAYERVDGRPVVALSGVAEYDDSEGGWRPHSRIRSQFESPTAFVETVRETLGGGADPYLVGELGIHGMVDYEGRMTDAYRSFASAFDALYEAPWNPGEGAHEWKEAFSRTFDRFWADRLFADDIGIEFEPAVFPGWNHTANACKDSAERIPRSPGHLTEMLKAADLLGTTDRIRAHSFNDWWNGTQLEPGQLQGDEYGRAYLDAVGSFQSSDTDRSLYGRDEYYVAPDGSDTAVGSESEPLASIQQAFNRARAGTTIHVAPGEYAERVQPPRGGEPGDPITITGPPDAVLTSDPDQYNLVLLNHSHIHIRGLTIDGLENPDRPEAVDSYNDAQLVQARPLTSTDEYLEDIVVAPHAIGNSQKSLVNMARVTDCEVGPFRVIGPAGAKYLFGDRPGHNGEIVYVGTSPDSLGSDYHPWTEYDQTRNIRIHHIDNSAGHGHSEIVNTKLGTHDITIEYCTDGGGSQSTESSASASIQLQSFDATVRWCDLRDGQGDGIDISSHKGQEAKETKANPSMIERRGGTDNSAYGNRITGFDDKALAFEVPEQTQADQKHVCGNTYDGATDGNPDAECSGEVPEGDGIGHTGGDSPW